MKKLLLMIALLSIAVFYLLSGNAYATEASYGDGYYSFANALLRSSGMENCWMAASNDGDKLSLGYGGNNYDPDITKNSTFQIVSNADGTIKIKYKGKLLIADENYVVKLVPEGSASIVNGTGWRIGQNATSDGACFIDWIGNNGGVGSCLSVDYAGNFTVVRPTSSCTWDIYRVDSNIVFQEQFKQLSMDLWQQPAGYWSIISGTMEVNSPVNEKTYNINKKTNSFGYKDYTLEGNVKLKTGTAGLIFRNDGTNMYLWSLDKANKLAELFKVNVATSQKTKLSSKAFTVSSDADKWYNLKITVKDNKMAAYVDGTIVDSFEDNAISSGTIGYWVGGTSSVAGSAVFNSILVKKQVQPMWYRSISSVHDKFKGADGKVITIDDKTDINTLDIPSISTSNFWVPFTSNFSATSRGYERYLFQTSVDVPENVSNLVISGDAASTISIDDKLLVYVNGRTVATGLVSGIQSITIDRKYLMPGAKNDILLVLIDTAQEYTSLNSLKVTTNLDGSYNSNNIIEYNGFKIQYDAATPVNSKIIAYPSNIMIDGIQMNTADAVVFDDKGRVKSANFNALLTGPVYKYNGWHKCQKIFSTNSTSNIDINIARGAVGSSHAIIKDVILEQANLDIFDLSQYISSVDATVNQDQSLSVTSDALVKIFGEQEDCSLSLTIKDNFIKVAASARFMLDEYLTASKKMNGYYKMSDLNLSGGFNYDIFSKKFTNYNITLKTFDETVNGAKVRLMIPQFGELSFSNLTIDETYITATNLGFVFADDCVFDGLRTSQDSKCTVSLHSLKINKKASSLTDLIAACDLSINFIQDTDIFGGMKIKSGSTLSAVVDGSFGIKFTGSFILPDDQSTVVDADFTVDTAGNFAMGLKKNFPNGINIKGISLSATPGSSAIGFKFTSAVYKDNVLDTPRKCSFQFDNVGTTINIPGAGDVIFKINNFEFSDKDGGTIENIDGSIATNISLFSGNMVVATGTNGTIKLAYNATTKWTISATNVKVDFPKVGSPALSTTTSFVINSVTGLQTFQFSSSNTMKFMKDFVSVSGFTVSIIKGTSSYSLTLSTDQVECDLTKIIPLSGEAKAYGNNLQLKINDISNPLNMSLSCGEITYASSIEFDMGIKFKASGVSINLNSNTVTILNPTFSVPTFEGIKYYKDAAMTQLDDRIEISPSYMSVGFSNDSWSFSMGTVTMPGAAVCNLFNLNVLKITMIGLKMSYNAGKYEIGIDSAKATVASGYSVEVTDVKITNDDVSIGGGTITIPELSFGGIGINNLSATFGREKIGSKEYPYFGGACGVTIPGLGSIDGSIKVQLYSNNFFGIVKEASFELTLAKAIPLGSTGLSLKMIRGSLTRGELPKNFPSDFRFMFGNSTDLKVVSMGLGLVDTASGGSVLKAGADVWVELTNWGFAMDLTASVFEGFVQAQAGVAYANDIFAARATVRVLCLEGKVIFYVYKYDGSTAVSGEGSVAVRLDAGKILNKKIWRWRIKIPRHDIWFDGLGAKFGRFTNGKVGFQVRVSFPVLGSMSAFVGDGGLKFFTSYNIYIPQPKTTTAQINGKSITSYAAVPMIPVVEALSYNKDIAAVASNVVAAATPAAPTTEYIMENGVNKGVRVTLNNQSDLERIVLSASTDKIIPSINIKYNGTVVPLDAANISTDIKEVEEDPDNSGYSGKVGVSYLLGIEKPANGTLVGTWVIEVRCDETVDVSVLTKLSDPTLKINSSTYNSSGSTLTVSGKINSYTGSENVTLALKTVPKTDADSVVPGERVVAVSKALSDMDGVNLINIAADGSFTATIDTGVMKTGTYSLVAELERKVTGTYEGGELSVGSETTEYNVSDRQEYTENSLLKKYDIVNANLKKVTGLNAFVTAYGSSPNYRYNLDVSFKNTGVADGYMLYADCYVDNVLKGTRKINLGNMSKTRIGQFTEYLSVTNGVSSLKPVKMLVYIVPYKYIDPTKGFIYDFGNNLGFETITNNITTVSGTESDKVEVWIKRSTSTAISSCSTTFGTTAEIPVEGTLKGNLTVNATLSGKVLVMVKSVTTRSVELGTGKADPKKVIPTSILGEAISVKIGNDNSVTGDVCDIVSGANNIDLTLIANVTAAEAKLINDANTPISVTLSVYNAENPDNYKEITIPVKFMINNLTVASLNQETFSSMTGGILDIYGTNLLKGTKVKLGSTYLDLITEETGIGRIAAKIPQGFTPGQYDLTVEGPIIASGTANTNTWGKKIAIVNSAYDFIKVRDTGNVKMGTTSKFYFRLESKTGYRGTAGVKAKTIPSGWTVELNKNIVAMGEEVEVAVTVPAAEAAGTKQVVLESCSVAGSVYGYVYSDLGTLNVTVTTSDIASAISSLSNTKPNAGETITIYGEGFKPTTKVEIDTTTGTKDVAVVGRADNTLTVTLPSDAVSGYLRTNDSGVYSTPTIPLVVVPTGVVANFERSPISVILAPGETTYIDVASNGKSVTTSCEDYITTSWSATDSKVKVTVPATTKPGKYLACANIKYPNTVVQQDIEVYVVDNGKSLEDLTRQVILTGRNLKIKVRGTNVSSVQLAKLELDGTALAKTPVKGSDGWDIDVGVVNNNSLVKYQFKYVISGTTFTTPVYEYKVQLVDPNNNDDLYSSSLIEDSTGKQSLEVNPKGTFSPGSITVKLYDGNTEIKTGTMIKDGTSWTFPIDSLADGRSIGYTLTFKADSTLPDMTTPKRVLTNTTNNPPAGSSLTYGLIRGSDGKVTIEVTEVKLGSTTVTPTWINAVLTTGTGTPQTITLTYSNNKFSGVVGDLSNDTKFDVQFIYVVDGVKYGDGYKGYVFNDEGYKNSKNGFVGEFYDNKYFSDLRIKTIAPQINYDFVTKAPLGGAIQDSTYSMRWSGKLLARYSESYTFYLTVPNGKATLWVDGKIIADGMGALSGSSTLSAGKPTDIIVEYATDGYGAIKLEWQSASQVREVVPQQRVIGVASTKPVSTDFTASVTKIAYDMVSFGWNPPSGVTGIAYYEVYEGTNLLYTIWEGNTCTITGLAANKDYTYVIKAKDSAGTVLATSLNLVFKTEKAPMDLALMKPVTASSTASTLQPVTYVNDGNSYTGWTSNGADPQWVRVDLGREYDIVKVKLNWREDYYAKSYKIQVSNDDTNWYDVYSTISGDGGVDEIRLSTVKARYIRMYGTERGMSNAYSLWDFNVYGYGVSTVRVQFYNQIIDTQNNNITPTFKIINTGTEDLDLNTLKLRYYYTIDKEVSQQFTCDWTPISPSVTGTFVKMASQKDKADYYLEIGFATTTPIVKPGEFAEVKARFNRSDWTPYTQTNDYSFDGVSKDYVDCNKITVYQYGNLIQGVDPT